MAKQIVVPGDVFGHWTVLRESESIRSENLRVTRRIILCRCVCGVERNVGMQNLWHHRSKSCGCLTRKMIADSRTTHGQSQSELHARWNGMRVRCSPKHWDRLGTYIGVTHDPRWNSFSIFSQDMGSTYFSHACLARHGRGASGNGAPDSGGYFPDNCEWQTASQNARSARERSMIVLSDGRFAHDVAAENGLNRATWWSRLKELGWPIDIAVTAPPKRKA